MDIMYLEVLLRDTTWRSCIEILMQEEAEEEEEEEAQE